MEKHKDKLFEIVSSRLDLSVELADDEIGEIIDECIIEYSHNISISLGDKIKIRKELFNSFRRLDILTDFLEDDHVTEIMVVAWDKIFVEKDGRLFKTGARFSSKDKLRSVIQQIVSDCNRRINEADPIVDARLKDGSRVCIVLNPISLKGPAITIRKFSKDFLSLDRLAKLGAFQEELIDVLEPIVKARYNIFISGGTGSGKSNPQSTRGG